MAHICITEVLMFFSFEAHQLETITVYYLHIFKHISVSLPSILLSPLHCPHHPLSPISCSFSLGLFPFYMCNESKVSNFSLFNKFSFSQFFHLFPLLLSSGTCVHHLVLGHLISLFPLNFNSDVFLCTLILSFLFLCG